VVCKSWPLAPVARVPRVLRLSGLVQRFFWCASVPPSPDLMPTFRDCFAMHAAAVAARGSSLLIGRPLSDRRGNGRLDSFSCTFGLVTHEVSAMSTASTLCASFERGDTPQLFCGVTAFPRNTQSQGIFQDACVRESAYEVELGQPDVKKCFQRGVLMVGVGSPRVLDRRGLLDRRLPA
jgi:hypothetical protein